MSACASAPPQTFDLSSPISHVSAHTSRRQLVVSEPIASSAFDSERIVVRPHANQLAYLSGVQWSDRLPSLVQARLIQAFENAKIIRSVGRPSEGLAADATLASEIRAFDIDVEKGSAVVEISVKLVSAQNGHVIAANVFSAHTPNSAVTPASALDAAFDQVLTQVVGWTANKI